MSGAAARMGRPDSGTFSPVPRGAVLRADRPGAGDPPRHGALRHRLFVERRQLAAVRRAGLPEYSASAWWSFQWKPPGPTSAPSMTFARNAPEASLGVIPAVWAKAAT